MLTLTSLLSATLCAVTAFAAPASQPEERSSLPLLKLPYATYQAYSYDSTNDIYLFKNIRYAAPPVGNLRWAPPAPPVKNTTLQDGSYGNICTQGSPAGLNADLGGAEDCLFLDVWVPGIAFSLPIPLPVLPVTVYTHGGAYLFGSKVEGVGTGPIVAANNLMIFVAMNYRLGSFGFLAGSTMEKQGLPNAGFYDQRAAYQWVQDYIYLVGGNPLSVTAWGESAGAGSILHHITQFGGTRDPLFSRAAMLSIASEVFVDRRGEVESFYQEFLNLTGCLGQSISCIRNAPFATLKSANQALILDAPPSGFKPGPAADGAWVRQMPALELASGNYWKALTGLIVSHVSNEGFVFVDGEIQTDAQFDNLVNFIIPSYAPTVRQAVYNYYPTPGTPGQPYTDENGRTIQYLDDTNFLCNYRYLNKAFAGRVWSMQYSVPPGFHSVDLAALFYPLTGAPSATLDQIYRDYQSYYSSFSLTGTPDIFRRYNGSPATIAWPITIGSDNENLNNVLNVGDTNFTLITDTEALNDRCNFFLNVQAAITLAGGYVPPGGAVANNLGVTNAHPSANYTTPS